MDLLESLNDVGDILVGGGKFHGAVYHLLEGLYMLAQFVPLTNKRCQRVSELVGNRRVNQSHERLLGFHLVVKHLI